MKRTVDKFITALEMDQDTVTLKTVLSKLNQLALMVYPLGEYIPLLEERVDAQVHTNFSATISPHRS